MGGLAHVSGGESGPGLAPEVKSADETRKAAQQKEGLGRHKVQVQRLKPQQRRTSSPLGTHLAQGIKSHSYRARQLIKSEENEMWESRGSGGDCGQLEATQPVCLKGDTAPQFQQIAAQWCQVS